MRKLNNSNFELIQDIISDLNLNCDTAVENAKSEFLNSWEEIIGKNISKMSKLSEISADNTVTVLCADSFVANELFYEKEKILHLMREKADKLGIKIKDIVFNYKKWKEQTNE